MGTLLTMYPPQNNSPYTTLEAAIGAGETSVTVADASVLPEAPNLLTIGTEENAEVVLMTAKTGNILTVQRGVYGTTAGEWGQSERIYRAITAKDLGDLQDNVKALKTETEQKAAKTAERTTTLTVAGWTGSEAPYTQTVAVSGLTADAHLIVGLAPSATAEQAEAAANAMLLATAQAAGSITVSAYGEKPDAAIPILIMEVG